MQQVDEVVLRRLQPVSTQQAFRILRGAQRLEALVHGLAVGKGGRREAFLELVGRDGVEFDAVLPLHPVHHQLAQGFLFRVEEVERPHQELCVHGGERLAYGFRQPRHHRVLSVGAVAVHRRCPAKIPHDEVQGFFGIGPVRIPLLQRPETVKL